MVDLFAALRCVALVAISSLGTSLSAQPQASAPQQLTWVAGDLPPFVWQGPKGPEGLAYDLATAMAQKLGRKPDVRFYPWARAVRMTREGAALGVFPLLRSPDREADFNWLLPLGRVEFSFFTRTAAAGKAALNPMLLDELRVARVGVLRGSPLIKTLQAQRFSRIVEATDYKELLRLLSQDVVDAVYATRPLLQASMDEYGYERSVFTIGAQLGEAELYMATSLRLDPREAEQWQRAYRLVQEDGTLARLQRQYLK